jgi:hypothetical protein
MATAYVVVRPDGVREEPTLDYTEAVSRVQHRDDGSTIEVVQAVPVAETSDPHRNTRWEER